MPLYRYIFCLSWTTTCILRVLNKPTDRAMVATYLLVESNNLSSSYTLHKEDRDFNQKVKETQNRFSIRINLISIDTFTASNYKQYKKKRKKKYKQLSVHISNVNISLIRVSRYSFHHCEYFFVLDPTGNLQVTEILKVKHSTLKRI